MLTFLLRTEGVSTLILTSSFGISCPDLLIFEIALGIDNVPFIAPSTDSDIISKISKCARPET